MKISVIIPLYNKKDTVLGAINSVLNQQVLPDEIIIVNDGSTDGSEKEVELLNHPLITLIHQKNAGVSAARNKGIEVAKSEWIAFLDADDVWKLEYLREINNLEKSYPDCNILATAYILQDYLGNLKAITLNKIPFKKTTGKLTNYFQVASCSHPPLCSSAIVVKKSAILNIGGFPVGIKSGEDLLTWARLAVQNKIAYSMKELSIFILSKSHNISQKPTRLHDENDPVGDALIKLYHEIKIKSLKCYISHWYKMRVSVYFRLKNRKMVSKYAVKSLMFNPYNYKVYLFLILILLPVRVQEKIMQNY